MSCLPHFIADYRVTNRLWTENTHISGRSARLQFQCVSNMRSTKPFDFTSIAILNLAEAILFCNHQLTGSLTRDKPLDGGILRYSDRGHGIFVAGESSCQLKRSLNDCSAASNS